MIREDAGTAFHAGTAVRIHAPLNVEALAAAWSDVYTLEDLRKGYDDVEATVSTRQLTTAPFRFVDASGQSEPEISRLVHSDFQRPFDLTRNTPFRLSAFKCEETEYVLVITSHHIASDGPSGQLIYEHLSRAYAARVRGTTCKPEPGKPYADFAKEHETLLQSPAGTELRAWWANRIADWPLVLALPTETDRARRRYCGASTTFAIAPETIAQLSEQFEGTRLFRILLAAWASLLHRLTGQKMFLLGTPATMRKPPYERTIGNFINPLVLRCDFRRDLSFAELVGQLSDEVAEAGRRRDYPFSDLVRDLRAKTGTQAPVLQTRFSLSINGREVVGAPWRGDFAELPCSPFPLVQQAGQDELTLFAALVDGTLYCELKYDSDVISAVDAERICDRFRALVEVISRGSNIRVSEIDLVTEAERKLLEEWNRTTKEEAFASIVERFEAQVARTPHAVAVEYGEALLTYAELDAQAEALAADLEARGIGPEQIVAVAMERSLEMVVALYGVMKAGAAYAPLDPTLPRKRIEFMLEDLEAPVVLVNPGARLELSSKATLIEVRPRDGKRRARKIAFAPTQLAYVIYTSGSTGTPKAAMNDHAALANRIAWTQHEYDLDETDVVIQKTPFTFDVSVWEFFWPLIAGARLVVAKPEGHKDPGYLTDLITSAGVTTAHFVPSMLEAILAEASFASCTSLRRVLCSGEALSRPLVERFHRALRCELHNLYGPTEAAVDVTSWPCAHDDPRRSVPIGRPVWNTQIHVLDESGALCPENVPGELHIAGIQVGRGYFARPALTAEKFVPNPFANGQRMYRTSDLARWHDAALEYLGRLDHQVKLRGLRIELGEIEATLEAHASIARAVVIARDDRLVAYVVARDGEPSPDALREHLRQTLPEYMLPAAFVRLDALPLTSSGKVDRKALPSPTFAEEERAHVAPRNATEETLASIWSAVLGVERIGVEDNFFELGGHSLLATQVVARIRKAFDTSISLRALFESPTIARLAARIAELSGARDRAPELAPRARGEHVVASYAQERMWFLNRVDGGAAYNMGSAVRLRGPLDEAALRHALDALYARHEVLRTTFTEVNGSPVQVIAEVRPMPFRKVDVSAEPDPARRADDVVSAELRRPFDLSSDSVIRALLVKVGPTEHLLALALHHIAGDAGSIAVMRRELSASYEAFVSQRPSALPPLPIQYADYAAWQREWMQGEVLDEQLSFWKEHLAGAPAALDLPTDRARPAVQTFRGGTARFAIDAATTAHATALGRRLEATPFMVLLSAFAAWLSRYSGQDDLVIGTPIANRLRAETQPLVGLFLNTLALRVEVKPEVTFAALIEAVKKVSLAGFAHQDVPFERVVDALAVARDLSRAPVFQVMFVLQHGATDAFMLGPVEAEPLPPPSDVAKFDLTLFLFEEGDSLRGSLEYNADLFDASTAARMTRHFTSFVADLVGAPDRSVSDARMSSAAEEAELDAWNATRVERPDRCVHELFAAQAEKTPDRVAVVFEDSVITYRALLDLAHGVAAALLERGVRCDDRVALLLDRSAYVPAAILGTLFAGGTYVPLDPEYPRERLAAMANDAAPRALVTTRALRGLLETNDVPVVLLDDVLTSRQSGVASAAWPSVPVDAGAYALFTSGSTGRPKAALLTHRALANLIRWQIEDSPYGAERTLLFAPLSFDVSFQEMMSTLCAGGALHVATIDMRRDPARLARYIAEHEISRLFVPFVVVQALAETTTESLGALRELITAGEALRVTPAVRKMFAERTHATLLNHYGPTEAHVVTRYRLSPDAATWPELPSIGTPIDNTTIRIVDTSERQAPIGVHGELLIGGVQVTRGYVNRPALTAEKLIPDSSAGARPGSRLYRTGDLARWRADGLIEYLGRIDQQVKIRGFRVEVGEVEIAVASHPHVAHAVVVVWGEGAAKRLVAYVVPRSGGLSISDLRTHIAKQLPEYMVPSSFVELSSIPVTTNRKVDRKALPPPDADPDAAAFLAPRDGTESTLAKIWGEVLGLDRVSANADFFALGGHSLLATRIVAHVRSTFGVELPVRAVFESPTLTALAAHIDSITPMNALPLVRRAEQDATAVASFAQERQWFLDRLVPDSTAYHMGGVLDLRGPLDRNALRRSLDAILARHEVLRTTYADVEGTLVQVIAPPGPMPFEEITATRGAEDGARVAVRAVMRQPFDLARGPVVRAALITVSPTEHLLVLSVHHICCDAWSLDVIYRDLAAAYAAFVAGGSPALPPLPVQYADYAVWQRTRMEGETHEKQLAFWREHLGGAPPAIDLPTDRPRPALQTFRGGTTSFALADAATSQLLALGQRWGASPFMVLLATFAVLLSRYSRQRDLVIGTPIANRDRAEIENVVGMFLNTLALRVTIDPAATFAMLVEHVKRTALAGYANQEVPFEQVVTALDVERDLTRSPLFQVAFVYQQGVEKSFAMGPVIAKRTDGLGEVAKFDLTMLVSHEGGSVRGVLEYNVDLFDASTIARMARHFETLVSDLAAAPSASIATATMLSRDEERKLLEEWNRTTKEEAFASIVERFEAQVARTPHAVAVEYGEALLTYAELDAQAEALAADLEARGIGPEQIVAVAMERSLEMVVALYGVMKAGAAYAPLDPTLPRKRIEFMLEDLEAPVVLVNPGARLELSSKATLIEVRPRDGKRRARKIAFAPTQLAYVIYTSGSTGTPKAAMNDHAALANRIAWTQHEYDLDETDVVIQKTPFTFDVSVWEFFWPLIAGARLVVAKPEGHKDPGYLTDLITSAGVTTAHFVPSMLEAILAEASFASCTSLRRVLCSGEALSRPLVERFHRALRCELHNLYGPTEAAVDVTSWPCAHDDPRRSVPIGRPVWNTQIHVLDESGALCPENVPGELHIAGIQVGRGYFARPALTAEKFVPNPFANGQRMYRTSDLARWHDAALEYLGRLDHQVKLRGLRIELGEIEATLEAHASIARAVVIARDDRLVAYVVARDGEPSPDALREHLRQTLPEYMLPAAFVRLDALPLTSSGKVDRKALPSPTFAEEERAHVAPRNATEETLASIWSAVLGVERIGVEDDFFELGGHSLLATRAVARIRKELGVKVSVRDLFESPTIAQLAIALVAESRPSQPTPLVRLQTGRGPRLVCVHELSGDVSAYQALARELDGWSVDGVRARDLDLVVTDIPRLAAHYVDALLPTLDAPFYLCGWSAGGLIAFEMAEQLTARGRPPAALFLLDTHVLADEPQAIGDATAFYRLVSAQLGLRSSELTSARDTVAAALGIDDAELTTRMQLFSALARAIREYRPTSPLHIPILLLTPKPNRALATWRGALNGARERTVGGDHFSMMRSPNVAEIGRALAAAIGAHVVDAGGTR